MEAAPPELAGLFFGNWTQCSLSVDEKLLLPRAERIYYFHNGGRPECVEVLVPIEDVRLQNELRHVLDTQLSDQRAAWDMLPDGMGAKHCQQQLIERLERRLKEATRLRRRKVQSIVSRKKRLRRPAARPSRPPRRAPSR